MGGAGGLGVDSIAVSLYGNMIVETGEIHIITKESEQKIQIIILILKRGPCEGCGPHTVGWGGSQITKCDFNTTDKRHICQDELSQENAYCVDL